MKTNELLMCIVLIAFCTIWTGCEQEEPQIGPTKNNDTTETIPEGFSVSPVKRVLFSGGNLVYSSELEHWYFCEKQYYSGYNDTRNHFEWGTGDEPFSEYDYTYDYNQFVDWGINRIYEVSGKSWEPNYWRTLTIDEWIYLLEDRTNAWELVGVGTIVLTNQIELYGLIIMPDNFFQNKIASIPWYSVADTYRTGRNGWSNNIYTEQQWAALEFTGAVFLPATGGEYIYERENVGCYWSSTKSSQAEMSTCIRFASSAADLGFCNASRTLAFSVRLVRDL